MWLISEGPVDNGGLAVVGSGANKPENQGSADSRRKQNDSFSPAHLSRRFSYQLFQEFYHQHSATYLRSTWQKIKNFGCGFPWGSSFYFSSSDVQAGGLGGDTRKEKDTGPRWETPMETGFMSEEE